MLELLKKEHTNYSVQLQRAQLSVPQLQGAIHAVECLIAKLEKEAEEKRIEDDRLAAEEKAKLEALAELN